MEATQNIKQSPINPLLSKVLQMGLLMVVFAIFFLSLQVIAQSARHLDSGWIKSISELTGNPLVALFIGLLAAAIIQSSSAVTAALVALVAGNALTPESAVFMVMGANIGTTVSCLLVAFGNMGTPKSLRRGFMVASSHVIFNVLTVLLVFVVEVYGRLLSRSAQFLASHISRLEIFETGGKVFSEAFILPANNLMDSLPHSQPLTWVGLGLMLLYFSIYLMTSTLKWAIVGSKKGITIGGEAHPTQAFFSGIGMTAVLQSSTTTTSQSVLLASIQKVSPKTLFPYIIGANLGTTITALLATIGQPEAALAIAFCHLLFNLIGAVIFFPFARVRAFPMYFAKWTANMAYTHIAFGFGYLLFLFFFLPFLVIFLFQKF